MTLTLADVTLTYPDGDGKLTALDRISLDVPAGSLTAVVGPSGSGKSSLLAVAATLVTPDSGRVVVSRHGDHAASAASSRRGCAASASASSSSSPICCRRSRRPNSSR